jgi:hypothetical protein
MDVLEQGHTMRFTVRCGAGAVPQRHSPFKWLYHVAPARRGGGVVRCGIGAEPHSWVVNFIQRISAILSRDKWYFLSPLVPIKPTLSRFWRCGAAPHRGKQRYSAMPHRPFEHIVWSNCGAVPNHTVTAPWGFALTPEMDCDQTAICLQLVTSPVFLS